MGITKSTDHKSYLIRDAEQDYSKLIGDLHRMGEYHALVDSQVPDVAPGTGNGSAFYSVGGTAQHIVESGLAGALPLVQVDTTPITVTQATAQNLSQTFTIPANDANQGTTYRITCWGNGTWGSTAQALAFGMGFPGTTEFGTHQAIALAAFSTSAAFRWKAILDLMMVSAPGATASWNGQMIFNISESANSLNPGTAANNAIGAAQGPSSNATVDSTAAQTYNMICWWGSTTGAPTITCHGSVFERLGP